MNTNEIKARNSLELEYCNWIDEVGLKWQESLPYTGLQGWSNGKFSIIYEDVNTESFDVAKVRFSFVRRNQ